jgi:hypothetical protein
MPDVALGTQTLALGGLAVRLGCIQGVLRCGFYGCCLREGNVGSKTIKVSGYDFL